jgi:general secretion pathway protein G
MHATTHPRSMHPCQCQRQCPRQGFTLIELIVVLAIIALLVSIVAPRYVHSVDNAREASLQTSLNTMRDAIDKYTADKGRYPASLEALVDAGYMRKIPTDPITGRSDSWQMLPPAEDDVLRTPEGDPGMADVRSGAQGEGQDGVPYDQW